MKLTEDLFLSVPFSEKDDAKKVGARWNGAQKRWFAPKGKNVEPFLAWLDAPGRESVKQMAQASGEDLPDSLNQGSSDALTLTDLMAYVQNAIAQAMPSTYWVKAELLHAQFNRHVYLELGDSDEAAGSGQRAKARAMIWQSDANRVLGPLAQGATRLQDILAPGMKLLLRVQVTFHSQFGLSLTVTDIDPTYTLGESAAKLEAIRKLLREEGVFDLNKALALPLDFTRILVISPPTAAGLGDFQSQADRLVAAGLCQFDYVSSPFQGPGTVDGFARAFAQVDQAKHDAVVVIRGGGDRAGLMELNHEALARHLCQCPVPVLVGIGHDRDSCVLDEVARLSCPTPSIVIGHIAGTIIEAGQRAGASYQMVKSQGLRTVADFRLTAERLLHGFHQNARVAINYAKTHASEHEHQLREGMRRQLAEARSEAKLLMKTIVLGNPASILEQGYAVAEQGGSIKGRAEDIAPNQPLTVRFADGAVNTQTQEESVK